MLERIVPVLRGFNTGVTTHNQHEGLVQQSLVEQLVHLLVTWLVLMCEFKTAVSMTVGTLFPFAIDITIPTTLRLCSWTHVLNWSTFPKLASVHQGIFGSKLSAYDFSPCTHKANYSLDFPFITSSSSTAKAFNRLPFLSRSMTLF